MPRNPNKNVLYVRSSFAPDGRTLAVLSVQGQTLAEADPTVTAYLVEIASGRARAQLKFKTFGLDSSAGTLVTEGRFLAYSDTNHFSNNPIRIWDFATGREVSRCQPAANVSCLALTLRPGWPPA